MQVYQLSMNEDRTIYSHVEAANVSQCINICTLEDNEIVKVNVEEVVFLEWLSKNLLLIQTKHNLLTYDITSRQKNEYVLFSFSNFKRSRALYKIMLNKLKECFLVGETSEKLSDTYFQLDNVQKQLIGDRQVPVVKIEPQNFKFKTVIFLNGGPDTYIRNERRRIF
ncbi:hypothetical protein EON06_03540 [Staphylococcus delphini]|nr:hypothetical protein [Staphylococcus delphini]NBK46839.1 hypothetical protein [Staphylococcus delphini]